MTVSWRRKWKREEKVKRKNWRDRERGQSNDDEVNVSRSAPFWYAVGRSRDDAIVMAMTMTMTFSTNLCGCEDVVLADVDENRQNCVVPGAFLPPMNATFQGVVAISNQAGVGAEEDDEHDRWRREAEAVAVGAICD